MTIDIHKVITGNPITKNLMKPWGSNKEKMIFNPGIKSTFHQPSYLRSISTNSSLTS